MVPATQKSKRTAPVLETVVEPKQRRQRITKIQRQAMKAISRTLNGLVLDSEHGIAEETLHALMHKGLVQARPNTNAKVLELTEAGIKLSNKMRGLCRTKLRGDR